MAWERRRNGRTYYYRVRRDDDRVVKEYVGAGEKGRRAADADQAAREARREAGRLRKDRGQDVVGDLLDQLQELDSRVDQLVACQLVCAGFRRHHRQWRASKYGRVRRRSRNT